MTNGEPENLVLHYLRSLDSRVNRVINDIAEVKTRLTSIETRINRRSMRSSRWLMLSSCFCRFDLVDAPAGPDRPL